ARRIKVAVDRYQFVIVMLIRILVIRWAKRIARVIHAGAEIWVVKIRVLMIKTKGMAHFLTGDKITPIILVVRRSVEISVIQLDCSLSNMHPARDPDLRDSQPSRIAIGRVANFDATSSRPAIPRLSGASNDCGIEH